MLTILYGKDWKACNDVILDMASKDVSDKKSGTIILVPELISHEMERQLCSKAGATASRYAEILTFSRFGRKLSDFVHKPLPVCLDNGGRVVAMAAACRQLHSKLKAYAAVETKPEFLQGMLDIVDEFKRCCISSEDLLAASRKTEGALAQKLEELSLILETYNAICHRVKMDPRDQMTWVLETMETSCFAENHHLYVDGFPDFTQQHLDIIYHFIRQDRPVVMSFCCDEIRSRNMAFGKTMETISSVVRFAEKNGIAVSFLPVKSDSSPLSELTDHLFQGQIRCGELQDRVTLWQGDSLHDECMWVAEEILLLIQNGARFRDISIVCSDMASYQLSMESIFSRCGIPLYQSGTEAILEKSVITTILSAIDAALGGFDQKEVIRYMKSVLSPVSLSDCDIVENYVITWNITGQKWVQEWTWHPEGLQNEWTEEQKALLSRINRIREVVVRPLRTLQLVFQKSLYLKDQIHALYRFMETIGLEVRLEELARSIEERGDRREVQILNQLWEILLDAMEQLYDVLGETTWDSETFSRLFKLLLSQYEVGTIPATLDAVTGGPVTSMRCHRCKYLFVLGVSEGKLPGYTGSAGVLSDYERMLLRKLEIPLTGGDVEGIQTEFSEVYDVFCSATDHIYVSCSDGQPSFLFRRILEMVGQCQAKRLLLGSALTNPVDAGAFLARYGEKTFADKLNLSSYYQRALCSREHSLGNISTLSVQNLYGKLLHLSASQIDLQAKCRLSYFLKYGLKIKERKSAQVDPAEFGTFVHEVLEKTAAHMVNTGGFKTASLADTLDIARKFAQEYIDEHFSQLDSSRQQYLFRRNGQELEMIIHELWQEFQHSEFQPAGFEVGFGRDEEMDPVVISGKFMGAELSGYVDRIDTWKSHGNTYFRVVDYKTGKKDFDYCDVFNGIGLQMLLYLFSLQKNGESFLGENVHGVAVQYFPARAPFISTDGALSDENAEKERIQYWKRRGLVLDDLTILSAMDTSDFQRLPCKIRKDGTLSGDIASREQWKDLNAYVFKIVGDMVDTIASGNISPNPYTRGSSFDSCKYCPYGAVCHPETIEERRDYKAMSADRFWEEIRKELMNRE